MPNKGREQLYLELFKECVAEFPDGEIISTERPDFLIRGSFETIGIELTEVFRPTPPASSPLQARERWEDDILRQAETRYYSLLQPPLVVTVQFDEHARLNWKSVPSIAAELERLIHRKVGQNVHPFRIFNNWLPSEPPAYGIESLSACRSPSVLSQSWQAIRAGSMHWLSPNEIQRLVDAKNARCEAYRDRCNRVWLVLIATLDAPSRYVELTPETAAHQFNSTFDGLFYFDSFHRRVVSLKYSHAHSPG